MNESHSESMFVSQICSFKPSEVSQGTQLTQLAILYCIVIDLSSFSHKQYIKNEHKK